MLPGPGDGNGRYRLTVYPEAAEAILIRAGGGGGNRGKPRSALSVLDNVAQLDVDPERRRDVQSRARSRIRRYCVANGCNVLLTPTYSDEHLERASDRESVELDTRNLVRFIRSRWGERFPYVSMPEVQPERSEREGRAIYNGMILLPRVPKPVFEAVREQWRYGGGDGYNGIDFEQWSDKRGGAQYASKALSRYASKSLGQAPRGKQAYRVGEGFQPRRVDWSASGPAWSASELLATWAEHQGHELEALREPTDDEGRSLDLAWAIW